MIDCHYRTPLRISLVQGETAQCLWTQEYRKSQSTVPDVLVCTQDETEMAKQLQAPKSMGERAGPLEVWTLLRK